MVGIPLNLNLNPAPSQFLLLIPVDKEAKKEITMPASVINPGYHEENRIAAT